MTRRSIGKFSGGEELTARHRHAARAIARGRLSGRGGSVAQRLLLVGRAALVALAGTAALGIGGASASAAVVTVTLDGSATGSVVSSPPGINCSNVPGEIQNDCSFDFPFFTLVELTASPAAGAVLMGWTGTAGGTCSGGAANPCESNPVFLDPFAVTATFSPEPDPPIVTTGEVSNLADPSATLSGTVNPNSPDFATSDCYFEFGTTTDYGVTTPCRPVTAGPGTDAVGVTGKAGGLEPETTYHYRIVASNAGGTSVGPDQTFVSAAASPDACPNAAIRAQQSPIARTLPDCMAYEMVSPLDTQGQRAEPQAVSDDGTEVLYGSVGGFAGTPNLTALGISYLARRGDSGWGTLPLAPSATEFPYLGFGRIVDWSADFDRTLWMANTTADAGTSRFTPIVREADGTITQAGPTIDHLYAAGSLIGASADLRSVLIQSQFRPALTDGTVDARLATRESLIVARQEADGTIGVRQVAYKDGATMFPGCALRLGGNFGNSTATSARGAISSDGAKIFFSLAGAPAGTCQAPANQRVWAKVGTADPIDLAESQCTTDCGAPQRAGFEGAARDGNRVYFTTEQKLVDADQDVTAGTKNDLYEYDFNRVGNKLVPVTVGASATGAGVVRVTRVSPDGSHVYFVANGRPLTGANARGDTPQQGDQNFYVYRRDVGQTSGSIRFIGALAAADSDQWAADVRRKAQTSHTGRYLLFSSAADLTHDRLPGDTHQDLFRYDVQTDDLTRIWTDDPAHNGTARSDGSFLDSYPGAAGGGSAGAPAGGGLQRNWDRGRQMSEDGSKIMLETKEPLGASDMNTEADAYLWQQETGGLTMLTSGRSSVPARLSGMTPSGDSLMVLTTEPLVKAHTSGSSAAYVARTGGGFPDQPAPSPPCQGEACQGPPAQPGPLPSVPDYRGPGNVLVAPPKVAPSIRVNKIRTVRGTSTRATVKVPEKGKIRVSGRNLVRTSKTARKSGTVRVLVKLTKRGKQKLRRDGRVKTRVSVRFSPEKGKPVRKRVSVTFRSKVTKRKPSSRSSNVESSDAQKGR